MHRHVFMPIKDKPSVEISCIWLELLLRCHLLTFPYEHWPESLGDFDSYSTSKVQQDQQLVRLHQHLTMYF